MATAVQSEPVNEWRDNWPLVGAAMAGISLSAVVSASIGVMIEPLEKAFGWSRTEISIGPAIVSFGGMLLAPFAGLLIDRIGARWVALTASAVLCAGIASLAAMTGARWQWWSIWALIALAGAAMPTVWMAPIPGRFQTSRGLAVAVAMSGSGIATTCAPLIASALLLQHDWRFAYVGLAGIWAVIVLPLTLAFFHDGRSGGVATKAANSRDTPSEQDGVDARTGLKSAKFYMLGGAAFLSMFAGSALILNLVPVLRFNGHGLTTAAAIASVIGVATICGRILGGYLIDRFNAGLIASFSAIAAALLPLALLILPKSSVAAAAAVAIYGLMGTAKSPAIVYLVTQHFGVRAFGVIYGAMNTMIAMGVGLGPLLANVVYDQTGSYVAVMWLAIVALIGAAALYAPLGKSADATA